VASVPCERLGQTSAASWQVPAPSQATADAGASLRR
jgi:hypothetical protein